MSKKKGLNVCPYCGSRNLQVEGHTSKGKQIIRCGECDEQFETYNHDGGHNHRIHHGGDRHHRPDEYDDNDSQ